MTGIYADGPPAPTGDTSQPIATPETYDSRPYKPTMITIVDRTPMNTLELQKIGDSYWTWESRIFYSIDTYVDFLNILANKNIPKATKSKVVCGCKTDKSLWIGSSTVSIVSIIGVLSVIGIIPITGGHLAIAGLWFIVGVLYVAGPLFGVLAYLGFKGYCDPRNSMHKDGFQLFLSLMCVLVTVGLITGVAWGHEGITEFLNGSYEVFLEE